MDDNYFELLNQSLNTRLIFSLISTIILYNIWRYYKFKIEKIDNFKKDTDKGKGLLFLTYSIGLGCLVLIIASFPIFWISNLQMILSLILSSASDFYLLLFVYFLNDSFIRANFRYHSWKKVLVFVFCFEVVIGLILVLTGFSQYHEYPLLFFYFPSLIIIAFSLYREFKYFGLKGIGIVSAIIILFKIGMIALSITGFEIFSPYSNLGYNTHSLFLNMILVTLAFGWLNNSSKQLIPIRFEKREEKIKSIGGEEKFKLELKTNLTENKFEEVVNRLINYFKTKPQNSNEGLNMTIAISSELYDLNAKKIYGTLSEEEYMLSKSKLINRLLLLIDSKL